MREMLLSSSKFGGFKLIFLFLLVLVADITASSAAASFQSICRHNSHRQRASSTSSLYVPWHDNSVISRQQYTLNTSFRRNTVFANLLELSSGTGDDNNALADDASNELDRNKQQLQQQERLGQLGFDSKTRNAVNDNINIKEPIKVRVDLIKDVDPVTLTAVGFSLLAINFLVLANMGDIGIAGIVARIINSSQ